MTNIDVRPFVQGRVMQIDFAAPVGCWRLTYDPDGLWNVSLMSEGVSSSGCPLLPDWLGEGWKRFWKGEPSDVPLAASRLPGVFSRRVYEIVQSIPRGSYLTYEEVAQRAGSPQAARAVGQVMRRNPWALFIPCHRVLRSSGKGMERLGGYGGPGGAPVKAELLRFEGVNVPG